MMNFLNVISVLRGKFISVQHSISDCFFEKLLRLNLCYVINRNKNNC